MTLHLHHSDAAAEALLEEQIEAEKTIELLRAALQRISDLTDSPVSSSFLVGRISRIAKDALR